MPSSNELSEFRQLMTEAGLLLALDENPSDHHKARNRWHERHLLCMALVAQTHDHGVVVDGTLTPERLLAILLEAVAPKEPVVYSLEELFDLLDELEAAAEDERGTPVDAPDPRTMKKDKDQRSYRKRIKAAFARGARRWPWRVGADPTDFQEDFLIGAAPPVPEPATVSAEEDER
jgi:hypothetical protein